MTAVRVQTRLRPSPAAGEEESDVAPARGTSVNISLAAGMAVAATAVFYALLWIPGISRSYIHAVFCERGPVQYATSLFFFWGVAILVLKIRRIRAEYEPFKTELLPVEPGQLVRQEEARQYIRSLKRLPAEDRSRLLTSRVWRVLVRFKLLGNAEKVDDLLKYQGEIDESSMESSYAFLKFLITIVPILGFLGTVLGISEAVSGFSAVIGAAGNLDSIKSALSTVTIGLATAFDTTLIALIMSAILMFGLTLFQRIEEVLLARIEDYCLDKVLDHLWVPPLHEQLEAAMVRSNADLARSIAAALK